MGRVIKDLRLGQSVSEHIGAEGKHRTDSPEHNIQGTSRVSGDHADRSRADIALDAEQGARLARTIEGEIIPRLKLAHGGEVPAQGTADGGTPPITLDDVEAFAELVLNQDVGVALAHVELLRADSTSLDSIFLDLLAPTAHLMGDLWLADEWSFVDVTIGLAKLQQILHHLTPDFEPYATDEAHPRRRAMLLPAPGEQHSFGVSMVEHFFRRAGWELVATRKMNGSAEMTVREEWIALIGFSLACEDLLDRLQSAIGQLRRSSCNPNLIVIVGGSAFERQPELSSQIDADGIAGNAPQAVLLADKLLASRRAMGGTPRAKRL